MRRAGPTCWPIPLAAAAALTGCTTGPSHTPTATRTLAPAVSPSLRHSALTPVKSGAVRVIGRSVEGRPIESVRFGAPSAPTRILVFGVIHGDEAAGLPIVEALRSTATAMPGVELVLVPDLNPDGVAQHTRQNAHGVDLNRNFPYRWQGNGHRGDQQFPGTAALSEPEAAAAAQLITSLRPTVTIWFHQPVGVVDESGGSLAVERRFAQLIDEPLRRLPRYQGSAASWQNQQLPESSAFVVELPHRVTPALQARLLVALRSLLQAKN